MRAFVSGAFDIAPKLSREEIANGIAAKEIEHMFYARVDDVKALIGAKEIYVQTQWGLWYDKSDENAASGNVRVRRNIRKGITQEGQLIGMRQREEYIMTTKVKTTDGHAIEVSIPTTEDNFKAFQYLADSGMNKHRYIFPIEGTDLKWEVDMFVKPGESYDSPNYLPWCKIDLEVPSLDTPVPEIMAGFSDMFSSKDDNLTDEQQEIVKTMKQYLGLPNPHVKKVYEGFV